ncbi:MAG: hypothetical protein K5840_05855 [Eubacterium sp.]|nr:hypothetical protein [Eubacterium sp.]
MTKIEERDEYLEELSNSQYVEESKSHNMVLYVFVSCLVFAMVIINVLGMASQAIPFKVMGWANLIMAVLCLVCVLRLAYNRRVENAVRDYKIKDILSKENEQSLHEIAARAVAEGAEVVQFTRNPLVDAALTEAVKKNPTVSLMWKGHLPGDLTLSSTEIDTFFNKVICIALDYSNELGCRKIMAQVRFSGTTMYFRIIHPERFVMPEWYPGSDDDIPESYSFEKRYNAMIFLDSVRRRNGYSSVYTKDGAGYFELILPQSCARVHSTFLDV